MARSGGAPAARLQSLGASPTGAAPERPAHHGTADESGLGADSHVMHQDVADITALEMFRRRHTAEVERHGEAEPDGPGAAGGGRGAQAIPAL